MSRRGVEYEVAVRGDGSVERILKDRRLFSYDLRAVDDAIRMIKQDGRRAKSTPFRVFLIEPDGYRTEVRQPV